jgi:DNA-binding MarR family transcriptional regulator
VFISNMRTALKRLEKRGLVRRVVREPEGWWELVE